MPILLMGKYRERVSNHFKPQQVVSYGYCTFQRQSDTRPCVAKQNLCCHISSRSDTLTCTLQVRKPKFGEIKRIAQNPPGNECFESEFQFWLCFLIAV